MKILLTTDTHFGNHSDFNVVSPDGFGSRAEKQILAFAEILAWGKSNKATFLYHLGDVFHKRGTVEPEVFNFLKSLILDYVDDFEGMTFLTGNHDILYVDNRWFNTAYMLEGVGVSSVVIEPTLWAKNHLFVPFIDDFEKTVDTKLHASGVKKADVVLFMHQSIFGAEYGKPITKGVMQSYLSGFKKVFCGHIHKQQWTKKGHTLLVGTPYPITFGDTGPFNAFIIDENGTILKSFTPKHPKFVTVDTDKEEVRPNEYDFYRLITSEPFDDLPDNMRQVVEPKVKTDQRLKITTDEALIADYVQKETGKKQADLIALGKKLLKGEK